MVSLGERKLQNEITAEAAKTINESARPLSERIEALGVKAEQLYTEVNALNDELALTLKCGPLEMHVDDAELHARLLVRELREAGEHAKAGGR